MGKAFKSYWKFVQTLFVFFYAFRKKKHSQMGQSWEKHIFE